MSTLFGLLVGAAAVSVLVPVLVLFTEVLCALGRVQPLRRAERGRVAVLMPAHDEASVILHSLRSVLPQLADGDRLLVIADNCSDDTAAVARGAGAEVAERRDPDRRGKGFALDFGVRHLCDDPPAIVIVVDADCTLGPGTIDSLARTCIGMTRPIQALYLMRAPRGARLKFRVAEFAFMVKNQVRALGRHRLGFPCQLTGTGMAFPWTCISTAALATGHIAEDLKLGIDLALSGMAPAFCAEACVYSDFAVTSEGSRSQRTRWEHGHLALIFSDAPRLVLAALGKRDAQLAAIAFDLCVPPLALLALLCALVGIAGAGLYFFANSPLPLLLASAAAAGLLVAILLAWRRFGRRILSGADLAYALLYAAMKIPLYVKFVVARQLDWVRSRRDNE